MKRFFGVGVGVAPTLQASNQLYLLSLNFLFSYPTQGSFKG